MNKHKCPECTQPLRFDFVQPAILAGRPDKNMLVCDNPNCKVYGSHVVENDIIKFWQNKKEVYG